MNLLRKLFIWFQIYSLSIVMDNRYWLMNLVTDKLTLANMKTTQEMCENELWRLKNEYRKSI